MKVELDIFELGYLLDSCLRGSHLRSTTIEKFVNDWYDLLTEQQRYNLYEWTIRLTYYGEFKPSDRCCGADELFIKRYDPDNQYLLTTDYNGKIEQYRAFLYNGEYHTTSTRFIAKEYITKVEKLVLDIQRTDYEFKYSKENV